jgi:hypothetical protein
MGFYIAACCSGALLAALGVPLIPSMIIVFVVFGLIDGANRAKEEKETLNQQIAEAKALETQSLQEQQV